MATLYNKKGQPVEIPDDQVIQALSSGEYGLPKGATVPMASVEGEVREFTPADAIQMADEGWQLETAQARQERETVEEYGATLGQEVLAGVAGAARGLTFGLSDQILVKSGAVEAETLAGYKAANPGASIGGEILGVAGGMWAPGAIGGILGAPVRGVAKLGTRAEAAVGRLVAPLARGGALGRTTAAGVRLGVGSAVEGALYGGGHFISEEALGNIDATAENLLGHVGMGAAIGGAFGAGLGSGFQGVKEIVGGGVRLTKKTADSMVRMWERQTGEKALPGLSEVYAKTSGGLSGMADEATSLIKKENRGLAAQPLEARGQFADDLTSVAQKMDDAADPIILGATGKTKKAVMRKIATEGDDAVASSVIRGEATEAGMQGGLLRETLEEINAMRKAGRGQFEFQGDLNRLSAKVEVTIKKADEIASSGKDVGGKFFNEVDSLKRAMWNIRKRMGRSYRLNRDPNMAETMNAVSGMTKRIQHTLEDASVFGEAATTMQKNVNQKWFKALERSEHKAKYGFRRKTGGKDIGEQAAEQGDAVFMQDPRGWESFVNDLGSRKVALDKDWLVHQMRTKEDLLEEMVRQYEMPPAMVEKLQAFKSARKAFEKTLSKAERTVGLQNQLKALQEAGRSTGFTAEAGVVAGALVGGPVGALVGGTAGALLNPARTIRQLATLDRFSIGFSEKIKGAISQYVTAFRKAGTKAAKTKKLVAPASVGVLQRTSFNGGKRKSKDRHEAFKQRVEELQAFVGDANHGANQIAKSTETMGMVAPRVAEAIQTKTIQAAQFLLDKAPKSPGLPRVFGKDWKPSETELSRFERFVEAVVNPKSIVDDLKNGMITHEAVEALETVYPERYRQVVGELLAQADDLKESLPYNQLINLSILFKAPLDETMAPPFIAAMQKAQLTPQVQQPQAPRPKLGGEVGDAAAMTNTQRLSIKNS